MRHREVITNNNLKTANPSLAKEWHPTKNGSLTPKRVAPNSSRKVWWLCKKGHEWQTKVCTRNSGCGCPYCAGKIVCRDNCLKKINPRLAREWHPTRNDPLTPADVTTGSGKKVWWLCRKGHQWQAIINSRKSGYGCPYCSGMFPTQKNCLQTINSSLALEWHPTRNGSLTPVDISPNSNKKAWWLCKNGHEWQAIIANRNTGRGCPYCASLTVCYDNCLQAVNPFLSQEWHPTKNGSLTPANVIPGSGRKVWWHCKKGHEWQSRIVSRSRGHGCPYCTGRLACYDNCLQTKNPLLAQEWHPTKNGSLTPADVLPGTVKKVWWLCIKGHAWLAAVYHRNRGTHCPVCSRIKRRRRYVYYSNSE